MSAPETRRYDEIERMLLQRAPFRHADTTSVPDAFRRHLESLLNPAPQDETKEPCGDGGDSGGRFSLGDAFGLAVGLDLLDLGFTPHYASFLMSYLRPDLDTWMERAPHRPSLRARIDCPAENFPALPTYEKEGVQYADARVFLILVKSELRRAEAGPKAGLASLREPEFCEGLRALEATVGRLLPYQTRSLSILEVMATAQTLWWNWDNP